MPQAIRTGRVRRQGDGVAGHGHDQPDGADDGQLEQADQADADDLAGQKLHRPDGGQQHLHDPGRLLLDHTHVATAKQ